MSKKNVDHTFFLCLVFLGFVSFADTKPLINIQKKEKNIIAKQKFEILVSIKTEKKENPYCFFPPEFESRNEKLSLEVDKLATHESENEVNFEVIIVGLAQEPGEYTIGPLRVPYILLSEDIQSEFMKDNTRVIPTSYWDIPSLQIEVKDEKIIKLKKYIFIGAGIFLIILASVFSYFFFGSINKKQTTNVLMIFDEYIHHARKYRLDGNYYEYLKTLLEIIQKLQEKEKINELLSLEQKLKEKMNEVGYKGTIPTEQEMDLFWKEVTNYVSEYENKLK